MARAIYKTQINDVGNLLTIATIDKYIPQARFNNILT
jgi:hypothetical protein